MRSTERPLPKTWLGRVLAAGPMAAAAILAGAPAAPGLAAQEADVIPAPMWTVDVGGFQRFDFHGEGSSTLVGVRARLPLGTRVLVEPAVRYTSFAPDADPDEEPQEGPVGDVQLLTLDFQVQAQLPVGRLRPWIGLGIGGAADFRDDRGSDDFMMSTFTAGAGLAFDVTSRLNVLGEVRYRTLDELEHDALDATVGVGWRF